MESLFDKPVIFFPNRLLWIQKYFIFFYFQDWLDEAGEIHITPVQAVFINSIHGKAEKIGESNKNNSAQNVSV